MKTIFALVLLGSISIVNIVNGQWLEKIWQTAD